MSSPMVGAVVIALLYLVVLGTTRRLHTVSRLSSLMLCLSESALFLERYLRYGGCGLRHHHGGLCQLRYQHTGVSVGIKSGPIRQRVNSTLFLTVIIIIVIIVFFSATNTTAAAGDASSCLRSSIAFVVSTKRVGKRVCSRCHLLSTTSL